MATIELYKSKINNMSNYINQAKSAVGDFCVDLSALKSKVLGINSSVCASSVASNNFPGNMQMVINVPKGAQGLNISNISYFTSENEVLFDYGQKMMITGAEYINNILQLNVTIIP